VQLQRSAESAGLDSRSLRSLVSGASALLNTNSDSNAGPHPPIKWNGFAPPTDGPAPPVTNRGKTEYARSLRVRNAALWDGIRSEADIRPMTEVPDVARYSDKQKEGGKVAWYGGEGRGEEWEYDVYGRRAIPALRRAGVVRSSCGTYLPEELLGIRKRGRIAEGVDDHGDGEKQKRQRSESNASATFVPVVGAVPTELAGGETGNTDGKTGAFEEEEVYDDPEEEFELEDYCTNHYESEGDDDPDSDGEPTYT